MILHTIMIVDDESIIRDGVLNAVEWNRLGFQHVASACDGEEALLVFDELKPDVILLDIRMPLLDGLEVLEYVKNTSPHTEVVLLSGFDEFSFVKKGMQLGAFDYVLKINLFTELEGVLVKLREVLINKREEMKRINHFKAIENDYMFLEFIRGRHPLEQSPVLAGQACGDRMYVVVSIWLEQRHASFYRLLTEAGFSLPHVLGREAEYMHTIFYRDGTDQERFEQEVYGEISRMAERFKTSGVLCFYIGAGRIKRLITDIPASYSEAVRALDCQRFKGPPCSSLLYSDWTSESSSTVLRMSMITGWVNWVYAGDAENLLAWMKSVFEEAYTHKHIMMIDIQSLFIQVLLQFEKAIKEVNDEHVLTSGQLEPIYQFVSLHDLERYLIDVFKANCRWLHESIHFKNNRSVAAVREYMDQLYTTNLRLEKVAAHFFFSPGYLSAKFKEFTGVSFSKYIIDKRIERACELLTKTDLKIYEIAERVGYSDEKHFSKLFKECLSMNPREYRNRHRVKG